MDSLVSQPQAQMQNLLIPPRKDQDPATSRPSKDEAISSTCRNRTGHWSLKENAKYYAFLKIFEQKFNEKTSRRFWKVFKFLAGFIKTRNANQCRSHHHKMTKDCGSIRQTLQFLREKLPTLEDRSKKYQEQLQKIDFSTLAAQCLPEKPGPSCQPSLTGRPRETEHNQCLLEPYGNQIYPDIFQKEDISLKKTREEYPEVLGYQQLSYSSYIDEGDFRNPQGGFPQTGILGNGQETEFRGFNCQQNILNYNCSNFAHSRASGREAKILQCQYYYLKWMDSITGLIAADSGFPQCF